MKLENKIANGNINFSLRNAKNITLILRKRDSNPLLMHVKHRSEDDVIYSVCGVQVDGITSFVL